jgi:hypothetical protein
MEILACEAFIRRAAQINGPFMLKGSFVGRYYFPSIDQRLPMDMDWVYLGRLASAEEAEQIFNAWALAVTELQLDDGVIFTSFSENAFWRCVDYAMSDDFPTTNTDITCTVDGRRVDLCFDISFNLDMPLAPAPLRFQPTRGDAFIAPKTAPLALQVAWKLHQTVIRPRIKDFYDLAHFFKHPDFDGITRQQALQVFADECRADETSPAPLYHFTHGDWEHLFSKGAGEYEFLHWMKENIQIWMKFLERTQMIARYPQYVKDSAALAIELYKAIAIKSPMEPHTLSYHSFKVFKYFILDACCTAKLTILSKADLLSL